MHDYLRGLMGFSFGIVIQACPLVSKADRCHSPKRLAALVRMDWQEGFR